ncbi:MAG: DNA recombination protein RmuC [Allosphingosinicella sp.]|uniref:DNA recombination protein RmuC n=1 Tax=Allosphingosinicella sp. TaxID=2823234 RepID=UPI003960B093
MLTGLIAVLAAVLLGWWLGGRGAAGLKAELVAAREERDAAKADADAWRGRFNEAAVNLAAEAEKVRRIPELEAQLATERTAATAARSEADSLRPVAERAAAQEAELARLRTDKEALAKAKAAFERGEEERQRAHDAQLKQLTELEAKVEARFAELASKAVDGAHDKLLKQAAERFGRAHAESEEKLKALLQPVEHSLKRYDEKLDQIEKARNSSYGELQAAVKLLHDGHSQVRDETRNLVNALRSSPKARGRWGEQSLKNVLEQAGLSPFADFQTEVSVDTEDGRLRPDVIVRLPGGRKLIIDAKCSLNAFLDANDAADEETRRLHLKAHAGSIRNHAQQLGSKNYWDRFGDAADYVVMYIPGEHFLTAALEQDDGLWAWAFERRVLLATPTNLVAIARTVASVWRQEKLAEEAAEIARLGKELHSRLATMGGHVAKLGRNLELANGAYNAFVGSLESQVMTQAKRFEALEVSSGGKEIEPLPMIESAPRPLTKLTVVEIADPAAE